MPPIVLLVLTVAFAVCSPAASASCVGCKEGGGRGDLDQLTEEAGVVSGDLPKGSCALFGAGWTSPWRISRYIR